jgi:hypothetical protein
MTTSKGLFFATDRRIWPRVTALGMNEAVAYLVLAQGTGRNHRATSWSANSLKTYAGISWERGKAAIEKLIEHGFIRRAETHTRTKPRYELATFAEWSRTEATRQHAVLDYFERDVLVRLGKGEQPSTKSQRKRAESLLERGILIRDRQSHYRLPEAPTSDPSEHLIWLPNTIVTGTKSGEESPVRRLRAAGDLWALRLFVELYYAHNLRDDGGIAPQVLCTPFDRQRVGQQGAYTVWGFKEKGRWTCWRGPLAAHQHRPKANPDAAHPVWESVNLLQRLGLLSFIPHIFENRSAQAEIIHPYGIGTGGEEPIETEIGSAADAAARLMCLPSKLDAAEDEGYRHYCPVLHTQPDAQMVGIARLRYRPHTRRTATWYAELQECASDYVDLYDKLTANAEDATHTRLGYA